MTIFIISMPLQIYANSKLADLNQLELRSYCSGSTSSEAELTKCLEKIFYTSQAELDKSQQKFFDALTNWYEDKQYIIIAKTKLKRTNQEFIKYRDLQCDFAYSLGGGAIENALNMFKFSCLAELNFQRTKQLDLYRSNFN
ncbi:lysozyme inhibitor LprI family protein [Gilliamella apicola]|nr:lysozyme inhibitor LprI family protein [Gilliamella apicola]